MSVSLVPVRFDRLFWEPMSAATAARRKTFVEYLTLLRGHLSSKADAAAMPRRIMDVAAASNFCRCRCRHTVGRHARRRCGAGAWPRLVSHFGRRRPRYELINLVALPLLVACTPAPAPMPVDIIGEPEFLARTSLLARSTRQWRAKPQCESANPCHMLGRYSYSLEDHRWGRERVEAAFGPVAAAWHGM